MNNNNKQKFTLDLYKCQSSDSFTTSTQTDSSPKSNSDSQISFTSETNFPKNITNIKEVYEDNLIEELRIISDIIEEYNYIGIDTEFPGTVYNINNITKDFYYKTLKINVDSLKLIQLGITITNEKGESPKNISYNTWQFNFHFGLEEDEYNEESIQLLKNSGINFEKLKKKGIKQKIFAEHLMTSGLVLNPDINWISYHGSYDFAYLLKLLTNENLPSNENEFNNLLSLYFHNYLDIKILVKDLDYYFNGGLNKLIYKLGISRKGSMHQAGSDSIATLDSFITLLKFNIINDEKVTKFKNVLYGLGIGQDNENVIQYTNCYNNNLNAINNITSNNVNNINKTNNSNNVCQNYESQINNYVNQNIKWFCPFVLVNPFGIINKSSNVNNMNS